MLSLYIHIPFCAHKCAYCSFHVIPENLADADVITLRKQQCLETILQENLSWKEIYPDTQLKTIHIGWGTPFQLWIHRLEQLVDTILETWDCEFLEELTIELNPDPIPEVLDLISYFQEKYKKLYKLRFSFGIQTLDNKILSASWRNYSYEDIQAFFRSLRTTKKHHWLSYNADFIAFGTQKLRIDQWNFFRKVLHAKLFDSFSLYTLELFPWSQWRNESQHLSAKNSPLWWNDDQIMNEFLDYQELIEQSGYHRYEISNFSLHWRPSIHNMRYWNHGSYLWLWPSASSFLTWIELTHYKEKSWVALDSNTVWLRWKNPLIRERWCEWTEILEREELDQNALYYEKVMLGLRTDHWINNLPKYSSLLTLNYEDRIKERVDQWLCTYIQGTLKLTTVGMTVYNSILTELLN